jgi:ribokinase
MRVLCAGHVNWDVTLRVDRLPDPDGEVSVEKCVQAGGGSAANVAAALAGVGADAAVFGSVGDDDAGRFAREELATVGVAVGPVVTAAGHETTTKYLIVDGDGEEMVLSNDGANEAFTPDDLDPTALESIDRLHLTSQQPATAAALTDLARVAGAAVSFDPGRRIESRDYAATIRNADLLFLNEREADALLNADGATPPLEGTTVVVKRGGSGATAHADVGTVEHGGYPIEPLDTTGAGDAFAAGFLAALEGPLSGEGGTDRRRYDRALAVANACGALASRRVGARAMLTRDRIEQFLDDHAGDR